MAAYGCPYCGSNKNQRSEGVRDISYPGQFDADGEWELLGDGEEGDEAHLVNFYCAECEQEYGSAYCGIDRGGPFSAHDLAKFEEEKLARIKKKGG